MYTAVSVRFISLPFPTMPLGGPARVVVDLARERNDDEDDHGVVFSLADSTGLGLACRSRPKRRRPNRLRRNHGWYSLTAGYGSGRVLAMRCLAAS